jgi:hypothetical protein
MAKALNPSQIADKQVERTRTAVPYFEAGVNAVTISPTAQAAEQLDKAAENYRAAVTSGRMAKRLKAVTLEGWRAKTLAKSGRIAEGVEAARNRIQDFHEQRSANQVGITSKIKSMPDKTPSDMEQRMLTQIREMRKFQFVPKVE